MSEVLGSRWSLVTLVSFLIVSLLSPPNPSVPPGTPQHPNSDLRFARHIGDGLVAPEGEADAIAVAPDGSTYVTGTSRGDVFVARIAPDGSQVLSFTYLGGSGEDAGTGIAVDADGSILVTGSTRSADFPLRRPLQKEIAGGSDAFVARLDKDGVRVLSATYLGGAGDDEALAIALDGSGGAWITGETSSRDFPVTSEAPQQAALGNGDAFVSHLNAPGNRLIESTYLGGVGRDQGLAIGVDSEGRVVVAGATASVDFPIVSRVNAAQSVYGGAGAEGLGDAFVAALIPGSRALAWSTYLGGAGDDSAHGLALDPDGGIYLAGRTTSGDFPTQDAFQPTPDGGSDGFVARLEPDGGGLVFSSYLGGAGEDSAEGIVLDGHQAIVVAGSTTSTGIGSGANPQGCARQESDLFLIRVALDGTRITREAIVGGSDDDQARTLALGARGDAWVAGPTGSTDFESDILPGGASGIPEGGSEPFVALISSGAAALTCPGTINFDNSSGTSLWTDPNNWDQNPARLPNATDDVCIGPAFSVTFASGTHTINSLTSSGSLTVDGGTLTINEASTLSNLTMSGGIIAGAGTIDISGLLTWTGGRFDGPSGANSILNANGGITINAVGAADFSHRTINSPGTTTWMDGNFRSGQNGVFNNTGTFKDQTSADQYIQNAFGGVATFNNIGTFEKTSATETTVTMTLNNTKTASSAALVHLVAGSLVVQAGGSSTGGTFTGDSGSTLRFNSGTSTLDGASSIGAANVVFDGGTVTMDGTYNVTTATTFSGATVTFNAASVVTSIGPAVTVSSGTATMNSGNTLSPATITMSGGILGGSDQINISGLLTWTGGRFDGPSGANSILNANGGITINAVGAADFSHRTINSPGTTTWMDGNLRSGQNGVFNNTGTFKDQTSADQYIQNALGGVATFNNIGTFEKTSATETTVTMTLNNTKTASSAALVHLVAGSLVVQAGGSSTGGTFTGDSGSTLRFNSGTSTLDGASSIGAANVVFDGGTVTMDGTYNVTTATTFSGATVTFNAASVVTNIGPAVSVSSGTATMNSGNTLSPATITMSGGVLGGSDQINISGLLTWTGGRFDGPSGANSILNANGGITINAASLADFTHRTINSPGTTTWMDGNFRSGQNGVFNNTGTFKDQTTADQYIQNAFGGVATFNNIGTFEKTSATETTVTMTLNNTKTASSAALVHLVAGSLVVQAGGSSTGGTFTGDSGSTLRFNSGTSTLDGASSIGAANVVFDGGTVTMDGTYNVTTATTFSGATVTFNAASVVTNIGPAVSVSSGTATMNSGNTLSPTTITMSGGILGGSDQINISGLLTWTGGRFDGPSGANSILNANGGITINAASLADFTHRTINSPGTTTWMDGNFRSGQNGVFNNTGTFKDQTTADQYIQNAFGGVATFNNIGTFEKTSATETTVTMTLNNSGTMDAKGGTLAFQDSYVQTSGTTKLTGGAISTTSSLAIQGGSLAGSGTITGDVACSGTGQLSPGLSPGLLAVVGDYAQSGGTYAVELGGLSAGTQFDQANLSGSGAATLGGSLNVTVMGGFTPTLGNAFTIMNFVSRTGTFATQNLPALPAGLAWNVTHGATSVILTVATTSSADLALTNSDSPDPVSLGNNLTYTISISNNGPNDATGLTMTDTLPAGVSYVSATGTGWTCGHASGVVNCSRASLAASSSAPLSIVVTPGAAPASLNNTAVVAGAEFDPTLSNNTDSEGTTVNPPTLSADLSIAKTDSPDPVNASAALAYTLSVSNAGPDTASSVSVADTLPAGVSFVNATGTGWSCGHAAGVVTCTRTSLAVGAAPAITINVTAPAAGGGISNTATVASATGDPAPGNNVDSEGTTVNPPALSADLSIAKTDSPDPVNASAALAYTLSVSNAGPDTASSISVADTLPAGVSFVNATGTGWSCGQAAGVVTCTRTSLAVGAAPAIIINVTAPSAGGSINNTATVASATGDPVPGNNSDSEATLVTATSLSATVRFSPRSLNASSEGGTILGVLTLSSGAPDPNTILVTQVNGIPITPLHNVSSGSSGTQYKFARLDVIVAIEALLRVCTTGMPVTLTVSGASTTGTPFTASDTITYQKKAPCPDGAASCLAIKPPSLKMSATSVQPFLGTIGLCLGDVDPASVRITAINGDEVTPIPGVLLPGGKKARFAFERTAVRDAYLAVAGSCPARQVASAELEVEGVTILGDPFEASETITIVCGEGL